jgi:hypothetical protein
MKKKNKVKILLVFLFFLTLYPDQSMGFVFDLATNQLAALSAWAGPLIAILIVSLVIYLVGLISLWFSTLFLNAIIHKSTELLTLDYPPVLGGWSFSVNIVNSILIIAFIIIAFAVIIGSEKIQLKKALPRLIMVALLVNFTLLFVRAGIDISNFLMNSVPLVSSDGQNIFMESMQPLIRLGVQQWVTFGLFATGSAAGLIFPQLNVIIYVGWLLGFAYIIEMVLKFIIFGAIMLMLSIVFFIYFLIFLLRIFIIQILAIIAPLAFFCLIFEKTKKHWDAWLNALVQWLFVGVVFLFLMGIALNMVPYILDIGRDISPSTDSWFLNVWFGNSITSIFGYVALLAYFIVILGLAKKFIPKMAQAAIAQVKSLGKMAESAGDALVKGSLKNPKIKGGVDKARNELKRLGLEAQRRTPVIAWGEKGKRKAAAIRSKRNTRWSINEARVEEEAKKKEMEGIAGTSKETKEAIMKNDKSTDRAKALYSAIDENQKIDKSIDVKKIMKEEAINKTLSPAQLAKIENMYPKIAAEIKSSSPGGVSVKEKLAEILKRLKPEDIEKMSKDSFEDKDIVKFMTSKDVTTNQLAAFTKNAPEKTKKEIEEAIEEIKKGIKAGDPDSEARAHIVKWAEASPGVNALGTRRFQDERQEEIKREEVKREGYKLRSRKYREKQKRLKEIEEATKAIEKLKRKLIATIVPSKANEITELIKRLESAIEENKKIEDVIKEVEDYLP